MNKLKSENEGESASISGETTALAADQFEVRDDASANWLIRQIIERRAYAKRCAEWCERELTRARHEEESFLYRYGDQLRRFAQLQIEATGGRRKSVNLPAGTIGFRAESPKLIIDDEPLVIAWAKANCPRLITTIERLSKSELNEHVKQTGELPNAGAHIEPAGEKFYVK